MSLYTPQGSLDEQQLNLVSENNSQSTNWSYNKIWDVALIQFQILMTSQQRNVSHLWGELAFRP